MEQEEAERILCDDGCCIGTINEKGICGVCGKPKARGRYQEEGDFFVYTSGRLVSRAGEGRDIEDRVKDIFYIVVALAVLGAILFIGVTFLRIGWKLIKWAWE